MRADPYQVCLITVDGTDFKIQEPSPFDPSYYSHKFQHAGLRYEIGICIKTGWIVWVNGPFPCGAWPDLRIARSALHGMLLAGEMYLADGGYREPNGYNITPSGYHDFEDKQRADARARHETINGMFKVFKSLNDMWRHQREKHSYVFHAVANVVQIAIRDHSRAFEVDYDEAEFGDMDFGYNDI